MWRRLASILALIYLVGPVTSAKADDESRLARISYIDGRVSFQHENETDWAAASINMALQPADRIYTGENGRAEIEFDDGSVLRLAEKTDVEILSLRDDLIQFRILLGLASLTVRSDVAFEVDSPAAAFSTLKKGIYRFDIAENGNSDGIVRKGELEASNNDFTQRAQSGELVHVTAGEGGTHLISRYEQRDAWDEWTDRRNADLNAYDSRRYIPDYVSVGVSDLDRYGRWVDVDGYGPGWIPSDVDASWSPYWEGRWCYRPFWGWTWVSYEPWGWLPYHYGRWHHSSFGWCWLPGPSYGFHFWSPGLVRFYYGSGWLSWCPLGPGDYYNVNNYYFHSRYSSYLNNLRLVQRRSPDDLANRHIPGAFRSASTDQFLNSGFGRNAGISPTEAGDQPWKRGRMALGQPDLRPTARSFNPAPGRVIDRPSQSASMPTVIRTEPTARPSGSDRFTRITNPETREIPASRYQGRSQPGAFNEPAGRSVDSRTVQQPGSYSGPGDGRTQDNRMDRGSSIWNRMPTNSNGRSDGRTGRVIQNSAPGSGEPNARPSGRDVPGNSTSSGASSSRTQDRSSSAGSPTVNPSRESGRGSPGNTVNRPDTGAPRRQDYNPPRYERTTPPPSRQDNPRQDSKPKPSDRSELNNFYNGDSRPVFEPSRSVAVHAAPQRDRWASPIRSYSPPATSGGDRPGWNMRQPERSFGSSPSTGPSSGTRSGQQSGSSRGGSGEHRGRNK